MKRHPIFWMIVILSSAALACRMPFIGNLFEKAIFSSKLSPTRTAAPTAEAIFTATIEAPAADTEAAPEPTMTEQSKSISAATAPLQANGVEITLPDSFQLGDVNNNLEVLFENLPPEAQPYEQMMRDFYEINQDDIILWAYDTENLTIKYTNLLIIRNEDLAGIPLSMLTTFTSAFMDEALEGLLQETMVLGGREMMRLLTTAQVNDEKNTQVLYLFNEADALWLLGFFTNQADTESQLSLFDDAVASFTILSSE